LGLVPARSGSTRTQNKNGRRFAGRSLIDIAVREALLAKNLNHVGFSTDSQDYIELAKAAGLDETYLRPGNLSASDSSTAACAIHYVDSLIDRGIEPFTHIVILQPTSPFRTFHHIDAAISQFCKSNKSSLVSVTSPCSKSSYLLSVNRGSGIVLQECNNNDREFFVVDGSIFITSIEELRNTETFWNDKSELFFDQFPLAFDIDTGDDFSAAEALFQIEN
jgi:CMP-N,N'-diacetyllegionaminic acid synthase